MLTALEELQLAGCPRGGVDLNRRVKVARYLQPAAPEGERVAAAPRRQGQCQPAVLEARGTTDVAALGGAGPPQSVHRPQVHYPGPAATSYPGRPRGPIPPSYPRHSGRWDPIGTGRWIQ
jgi:hypothetical protein